MAVRLKESDVRELKAAIKVLVGFSVVLAALYALHYWFGFHLIEN